MRPRNPNSNVFFCRSIFFKIGNLRKHILQKHSGEKEDVVVLPENLIKKDKPLNFDSGAKLVRMNNANVEYNVLIIKGSKVLADGSILYELKPNTLKIVTCQEVVPSPPSPNEWLNNKGPSSRRQGRNRRHL
jgi:hypothetical protein